MVRKQCTLLFASPIASYRSWYALTSARLPSPKPSSSNRGTRHAGASSVEAPCPVQNACRSWSGRHASAHAGERAWKWWKARSSRQAASCWRGRSDAFRAYLRPMPQTEASTRCQACSAHSASTSPPLSASPHACSTIRRHSFDTTSGRFSASECTSPPDATTSHSSMATSQAECSHERSKSSCIEKRDARSAFAICRSVWSSSPVSRW
mmetsp:Transcript_6708/g.16130  ORF Transcript_6708/g.16130 Transcript_6708/m.16130 type:complete len:209 (-) Transcript_6708:3348-3974(-)